MLRHPLCLALVRHKWKSFGRYVYYGQLFLYLLFLFFLTSYLLMVPNPAFTCEGNNATDILPEGETCDVEEYECPMDPNDEEKRTPYERISQIGIMVLIAWGVVVEVIQLYRVRLYCAIS